MLFIVLLFALISPLGTQAPSGSNTPAAHAAQVKPLPTKPAEILQTASTMNGVDIASAKPWHIKLSYDEFDEDGDNIHSGTFEEFYVGPTKYRQIYGGDTLTQTDVATESGLSPRCADTSFGRF